MNELIGYAIPIKGLKDGLHKFEYAIGAGFFKAFENPPVQEADVQLTLTLDKKHDLIVLLFDFEGRVSTVCDRCLADIQLPISGHDQLLVKFSEETSTEDPEILLVHPESPKVDVSGLVYEFICLALPLVKVYDCTSEPEPPCNQETLRYLDAADSEGEDNDTEGNPIWEALKKIDPTK